MNRLPPEIMSSVSFHSAWLDVDSDGDLDIFGTQGQGSAGTSRGDVRHGGLHGRSAALDQLE